MTATTFSQALSQEVLVFDGAMGTEIYRHHIFTNRCFDELSLSDPQLIRRIHNDYIAAGADVITTNTYGANRIILARFGLAEKTRDINHAGASVAKQCAQEADRPIYVAGSVGPLLLPSQHDSSWQEILLEQIDSLVEGGSDLIIFETQLSRLAMEQCAGAMQMHPETPYILSFAVDANGETVHGDKIESLMAPLPSSLKHQPCAWGLNCGTGPDGLLGNVEKAVRLTTLPLIVQPNAGTPKEVDHRHFYLCSPEYFTEYGKRFVTLGVSAVGGCCGTTPEHIRELAETIKPLSRMKSKVVSLETAEGVERKKPAPLAEKSEFGRKLAAREWVVTVELLPPRGYDLKSTLEKSRKLRDHGIAAINIPDGPRASARISPLITAERIYREAGIEPILHFCCRDRNLIGMQADLLACAACHIHNILFITGDPPKLGNYPHATGVFDSDSIGMTEVQKNLNEGVDLGGQAVDPQTFAVIGVGLDPTALDRQRELERFRQKIDAGAEFAITQPVFDPDSLLRMLDDVQKYNIPIIAGIWPLISHRNATFMQNEVPGVVVPDSIMQRMAAIDSREGQLAVGIQIAKESVVRIRDRVAGIQVSAPLGNIDIALAVAENSKNYVV